MIRRRAAAKSSLKPTPPVANNANNDDDNDDVNIVKSVSKKSEPTVVRDSFYNRPDITDKSFYERTDSDIIVAYVDGEGKKNQEYGIVVGGYGIYYDAFSAIDDSGSDDSNDSDTSDKEFEHPWIKNGLLKSGKHRYPFRDCTSVKCVLMAAAHAIRSVNAEAPQIPSSARIVLCTNEPYVYDTLKRGHHTRGGTCGPLATKLLTLFRSEDTGRCIRVEYADRNAGLSDI